MNTAFCQERRNLRIVGCRLLFTVASVLAWSLTEASADEHVYGAFGPEGPRMREQLWILPSGEEGRTVRATVFRPDATQEERNTIRCWIEQGAKLK